MPEISVQKQCAQLKDLVDVESFGEPVGPLPKQTDSGFFSWDEAEEIAFECEPGTLKIDLAITEFCHLLAGRWILTSDSGKVTEVEAGDSWVFPKGWKGTGEVVETVRKVYIVIE